MIPNSLMIQDKFHGSMNFDYPDEFDDPTVFDDLNLFSNGSREFDNLKVYGDTSI